jgi:hypothetical protein
LGFWMRPPLGGSCIIWKLLSRLENGNAAAWNSCKLCTLTSSVRAWCERIDIIHHANVAVHVL